MLARANIGRRKYGSIGARGEVMPGHSIEQDKAGPSLEHHLSHLNY